MMSRRNEKLMCAVLLAVACATGIATNSSTRPATTRASESPIQITGAWARPSAGAMGAAYLEITNRASTADRLIGVSSDVAKSVEIHESYFENDVARMRRVDGLDLPPGGRVTFKPGEHHFMLIGLKQQLKSGEHVALTLRFQNSDQQTVQFNIEER